MAAAADLSAFAEPGFDCKAWVNSACDRRAALAQTLAGT
jgi:hypothetical protein